MTRPVWGAVFVFLVVACASGGSEGGYTTAVGVLAGTVVVSGINRAATGDCWAQCTHGYACDRPRGTCVRAECDPECAAGEHCVIEADARFRCIDGLGTARLGASASGAPSASVAPSPGVAPAVNSATPHY